MITLAFDCCLAGLSVAVLDEDRLTVHHDTVSGGQAERLMPTIDLVLQEAGRTLRDVSLVAVTLGPGGFTSVRVGIAAARGFAVALGIPAVGQSSLQALADAAIAEPLPLGTSRIIALVPAGRGGVYRQMFDPAGHPLEQPQVIEAGSIAAMPHAPTDLLVGPGTAFVPSDGRAGLTLGHLQPRADILARKAKDLTRDGELRPIYLRAADAKPQTGKALRRVE